MKFHHGSDVYPSVYCQGSCSRRTPDQDVPVGNCGFAICDGGHLGGEACAIIVLSDWSTLCVCCSAVEKRLTQVLGGYGSCRLSRLRTRGLTLY